MARNTDDKQEAMRRSMADGKRPPAPPVNVARSLAPAAQPRATKDAAVDDAFDFEVAFKLAFLGAGQGGGRIAAAFYKLGYRRVCAFNTTAADFKGLPEELAKLALPAGGAGKDTGLAARLLEEHRDEVGDHMLRAWGNDIDYAFICAALGGGTGSGTVAGLVELARRRTPRVGAVVSLPPAREGQRQCVNALSAFKALLALQVSPLVVIDNARVHAIYKPGFLDLYGVANNAVVQLLHLFNQLAAVHSELITFDAAELGQLLDGGIVTMGAADLAVAQIQSPADVSTAIRERLAASVLVEVDLKTSSKAGCLFVASEDVLRQFSQDYFDAGFEQLERLVSGRGRADAVVHRGVYPFPTDGVQCYTMLSGLAPPAAKLADLAKGSGVGQLTSPKGLAQYLGLE